MMVPTIHFLVLSQPSQGFLCICSHHSIFQGLYLSIQPAIELISTTGWHSDTIVPLLAYLHIGCVNWHGSVRIQDCVRERSAMCVSWLSIHWATWG